MAEEVDYNHGFDDEHRSAARSIFGLTLDEAEKIFKEKYPQYILVVVWSDGVSWGCERNINRNRFKIGLLNGVVQEKYDISRDENGNEVSYLRSKWG